MIAFFKCMVRPELTGENTLGHWGVGQDRNIILDTIGNGILFLVTPEQRIGGLVAVNLSIPGGFLDLFTGKIRYTDGTDFFLFLEFIQGTHGFFNRYLFTSERTCRPVDLVKINIIRSQIFQ